IPPPSSPVTAPIAAQPAAAPALPGVPAPALSAIPSAQGRPAQAPPSEPPPGIVHFQNAPLEQVLEYYSDLVNRTLLRPATLPTASITLNTKNDLSRVELIEALDSVLGLNGIAMVPVGDKFLKVVPVAQVNQ